MKTKLTPISDNLERIFEITRALLWTSRYAIDFETKFSGRVRQPL